MKSDILQLRFTESDAEIIRNNAKNCGLTVSEYVRQVAKGYSPKVMPSEALLKELVMLHDKLNAIEENPHDKQLISETRELLLEVKRSLFRPEKN